MRELYVFVDSERPDQYLNSVIHCVLNCDVRRINFIHIKRLTDSDASRENTGLSARVMGAVQAQIQNLAELGEYIQYRYNQPGERIDLKNVYETDRFNQLQAYYKQFRRLSLEFSNQEIEYSKLRVMLAGISQKNLDNIIDITAVNKRYLGDIIAAALVEGIQCLWTFDLLLKPDFERPWKMLIHELTHESDIGYRYTNIIDTDTYKNCIRLVFIRAPRFRIAASIAFILLFTVGISTIFLATNSTFLQILGPVSSISSILSLAYVFWSPRVPS